LGGRKRALARIALALFLFFGVIYIADSHPRLIPLPGYLAAASVEGAILLLSILAMWNAGLIRGLQSRSRLALLEVGVLAIALVVLTLINGIECNPLALCITVGGSYMGEPLDVYLSLVGLNVVVAVSEEFFSRAYLLRDVYRNLNSGVLAVSVSSLVFALAHIPALSLDSFIASPVIYLFVSVLLVGLAYALVYWWTGWNLMLVVLLHFFYDTFGGMITLDPFDPLSPVRFYAVLVFVPGAAIVLFHYAATRFVRLRKASA
jgi:membrane protease YdiL (CAAX protease family)